MCFPLMCYLCLKVLRHHLQWMKPLLVGNDRLTDKQFFPFIQYKTTTTLHKENWNVFQINDNWKELTFQWNNEIKKPKNPHSLSSKITKSNEFSFIIFILLFLIICHTNLNWPIKVDMMVARPVIWQELNDYNS